MIHLDKRPRNYRDLPAVFTHVGAGIGALGLASRLNGERRGSRLACAALEGFAT